MLPDVLAAAREEANEWVLDLLVTVLADRQYAPAYPDFVGWMDHHNEEVRFAAALTLDELAGKRFGVEKMIEGGWVQHDRVKAVVPRIRAWWESSERRKWG